MENIAYTILEACQVARVGRTTLYKAVKSGQLPIRKVGRKSLILSVDLRTWLQNLPLYASASGNAEEYDPGAGAISVTRTSSRPEVPDERSTSVAPKVPF